MATTTTNAGFPKPSGTDPFQPDVDIANLADSVDSFIYSKFPDAITKTYSIPLLFATRALMLAETGRFTGQKAVVNADSNPVYNGDYKWSGTAWVRDSPWVAATKAALPTGTTITPQIVAGTEGAKATVTSDSTAANNGEYVWNGTVWNAVNEPWFQLSVADSNWLTAGAFGYRTLSVRRIGDLCHLQGRLAWTGGSMGNDFVAVTNIPTWAQPEVSTPIMSISGMGVREWSIGTVSNTELNTIRSRTTSTGKFESVFNVTYPVHSR